MPLGHALMNKFCTVAFFALVSTCNCDQRPEAIIGSKNMPVEDESNRSFEFETFDRLKIVCLGLSNSSVATVSRACPAGPTRIEDLPWAKELLKNLNTDDAWGHGILVECSYLINNKLSVAVRSLGGDGKLNTVDDMQRACFVPR